MEHVSAVVCRRGPLETRRSPQYLARRGDRSRLFANQPDTRPYGPNGGQFGLLSEFVQGITLPLKWPELPACGLSASEAAGTESANAPASNTAAIFLRMCLLLPWICRVRLPRAYPKNLAETPQGRKTVAGRSSCRLVSHGEAIRLDKPKPPPELRCSTSRRPRTRPRGGRCRRWSSSERPCAAPRRPRPRCRLPPWPPRPPDRRGTVRRRAR